MTEWHLDGSLARRFASDPRGLDDVTGASVEQHVAQCARCQREVAASSATEASALDGLWAEIQDRIDQPANPVARRFAGTSFGPALAATPGLRVGALLALVLVAGAAALVGQAADAPDPFLVIAPLVPAALVAVSFAPAAEPGGEAAIATPRRGLPLVLLRALVVESVAVVVLAVAALTVPLEGRAAAAWLLPALAFSLVTLAFGASRWAPTTVAAVVAMAWVAAVALTLWLDPGTALADTALLRAQGQVAWALTAAAAGLVIASRRHELFQEVR